MSEKPKKKIEHYSSSMEPSLKAFLGHLKDTKELPLKASITMSIKSHFKAEYAKFMKTYKEK